MFNNKVANLLSAISFVLSVSIIGTGTFGYFWFKANRDTIQEKLVKQIMSQIKLPNLTSPALPTAPVGQNKQLPKF